MTNYAKVESKEAWIKYDFGNELARKWFGDEVVDALPKITRGKNKGKPKGVLCWENCYVGGWVKAIPVGYPLRPGIYSKEIRLDGKTIFVDPHDLSKDREGNLQSGWLEAACFGVGGVLA
jgi:hypothetical protein